MTITSNPTCTEISIQTPDTGLLGDWYSGQELDVDITWSLNDCTDSTVKLPNRYPFDGTITNCGKVGESLKFRLNITGIAVGYVNSISINSYSNITSVTQISTLVYELLISPTQFLAGPEIVFVITDTSGNQYTVTYQLDMLTSAINCNNFNFENWISVVYPELPCGVTYDFESGTMTFTYGFFFGGDCEATTELPCGVYNMALESETSCVFVCCDFVCLATSAFELKDLTETLDVYQALVYLNELHSQGSTCVDCNQMVAIYTYLRSLTNTTSNGTSTKCGCG